MGLARISGLVARILGAGSGLMMAGPLIGVQAQTISPAPTPAALSQNTADTELPHPIEPLSSLYGSVEYLGWWVKGAPLSVPLVSTGPISTTHHGWLNSADSTILYGAPFAPAKGGNDTQPFPYFSGSRVTLGYTLDNAQRFAIELSGFALQSRSPGFEVRGDENGEPVINIPVYNTIPYTPGGRPGGGPPAEDGLPASLPSDPDRFDSNAGVFTGRVKITNSLQLWGAGLTAVANVYRANGWELSGLTGLRFLRLAENFKLFYESVGVSGVYVGDYGTATDMFGTKNSFYGATLGLRGRYTFGRMFMEASGSVAFGASSEILNVDGGFSVIDFLGPMRAGPEGVFAQPANEGQFSSVHFAVVPEIAIKLGYNITPAIQLTLGYDFLYDSNVIRPGDQINRKIPKGQTFLQGGNTVSATSPSKIFKSTDFFAQGVTIGIAFRF